MTAETEDLEDLAVLRAKHRGNDFTVANRRARESRVTPYADRRKAAASGRTAQTNLKFTPATKKRLLALAANAGETMVEYLEKAMEIRAASDARDFLEKGGP